MSLSNITVEQVEGIRTEYGLNEQKIREAVKLLKDWLKQQPHLPNEVDDKRLERFILRSRNSIEKTKQSLDMYYTLKNAVPEFLTNRDIAAPWFKEVTSTTTALPLPKLTEDNNRVIICAIQDPDPSKYHNQDIAKYACLFHDIRLCEDYNIADIYIVDLANFSLGHTTKFSVAELKKINTVLAKAFQIRTHSIHFINVPSYIEVIMSIVRAVLKPNITQRIHVHSNGLDTLHNLVPKKILPKEYGGDAGSISDMHNAWLEHLQTYGDWLRKEEKFKSDESKRPGKAINSSDIFGFEGSFRQLSLD